MNRNDRKGIAVQADAKISTGSQTKDSEHILRKYCEVGIKTVFTKKLRCHSVRAMLATL
jgi:hypothetical protein